MTLVHQLTSLRVLLKPPWEMVEQHFCLRWNNYRTNITAEFETLREGEHFVDVTLACDGQQLKAHKVVLSACSPYFKELLQGNPCTHPIIILRDVAYTHMRSLLEFMYAGEVNISQVQLGAFLHTAEALKIRGLAESSDDRKDHGGLNSISPLSALKSSLSGLGNIAMGGIPAPSILERPLVPQLLPHHTDKQGNHLTTQLHLPPHLVPPPLSLAGGTLPTPPQGVTGGPPSSSSSSSSNSTNCSATGIPQGPLPLTVVSQASERPPRLEAPERTPSPPPPLPPCKRLRLERMAMLDPPPEKNNHGETTNGTASSTITTTPTTMPADEVIHTVPKIEPVESGASDAEVGGGWCGPEDGDSSSGGGGGGGG
ncbi:protein bric-a-brac 2, partial [Procambarus clarkii]|uniref:protein bric-a-brac 2 n=1 Tax=Procambarus clarkii TaxID=6728 RepID=UPI00374394E3